MHGMVRETMDCLVALLASVMERLRPDSVRLASAGGGVMLAKDEKRCAVYTHKSTDERLDTEFNSLDAQYDACASYIKSQVGMGWRLVEKKYDDGGYSGGTMNRPALTELIKDIEAGKIDVVVVYKIDRLSATSPTSPSSLNNTAYRSCRSPSR